ncbi:unnamed protein product [Alopecurus aequalis]
MAFAGVSVIADGKLLGGSTAPTVDAGAAGGYHFLVIEGHSRTRVPRGYVRSRFFLVGGHRWSIMYFPDGAGPDNAGFISLRLYHYSSKPAKAHFVFSFVDETEKQEHSWIRASRRIFEFDDLSLECHDRFMSRDALVKSMHFKDDSFTIRCDVLVAKEDVISPCIEVTPSDLKQNLTDLLKAGEGTDVVFQVGGEKFAAHRCVLAARSAVFKALLFGPMKEGSSMVVQVEDMDPTIFKAMLVFIYSDSLPAPADEEEQEDGVMFQHLFVAADRYGVRRLREMCEMRLCEHIDVGTATTIIALAEQHGSNRLKEACDEFLRCPANLKAVMATDGFDHLQELSL